MAIKVVSWKNQSHFCDQCKHGFNLKCFYQIPLTWWKTYFRYQKDLKLYNLNCTNLHDRPKYHRCLKLCPSHPTWWRTSNTLRYINFQAHTIYIGTHCRQYLELVQFWSLKSFLFTFFFSCGAPYYFFSIVTHNSRLFKRESNAKLFQKYLTRLSVLQF